MFGGICRNCPGILKCKDMPSESAPIEMGCVTCEGNGCRKCNGTGRIEITGCPLGIITLESWEFITFAKLYEKGLPPIAGGSLDQAKGFVNGCSFVFNEIEYWKKKLGIF